MESGRNALNWIRAFIGNRSQSVVLEGEESDSNLVTSGVLELSTLIFETETDNNQQFHFNYSV